MNRPAQNRLSDSDVAAIREAVAKTQNIPADVFQRLLDENQAMLDRSRLAALGVFV
jgi:hypothetical protein